MSKLSPKYRRLPDAALLDFDTVSSPQPHGSPLSASSINHGSLPPIAVQSWLSVRKLSVIRPSSLLRDWPLLKTPSGPFRYQTGLKGPVPEPELTAPETT